MRASRPSPEGARQVTHTAVTMGCTVAALRGGVKPPGGPWRKRDRSRPCARLRARPACAPTRLRARVRTRVRARAGAREGTPTGGKRAVSSWRCPLASANQIWPLPCLQSRPSRAATNLLRTFPSPYGAFPVNYGGKIGGFGVATRGLCSRVILSDPQGTATHATMLLRRCYRRC